MAGPAAKGTHRWRRRLAGFVGFCAALGTVLVAVLAGLDLYGRVSELGDTVDHQAELLEVQQRQLEVQEAQLRLQSEELRNVTLPQAEHERIRDRLVLLEEAIEDEEGAAVGTASFNPPSSRTASARGHYREALLAWDRQDYEAADLHIRAAFTALSEPQPIQITESGTPDPTDGNGTVDRDGPGWELPAVALAVTLALALAARRRS